MYKFGVNSTCLFCVFQCNSVTMLCNNTLSFIQKIILVEFILVVFPDYVKIALKSNLKLIHAKFTEIVTIEILQYASRAMYSSSKSSN